MMTPKEFALYLFRDTAACFHCGRSDDTLVPGHRLGRGHGGSRLRDVPSNICTMCSWFNGEIENNADARNWARARGLSLTAGQIPSEEPAWNYRLQSWVRLDDAFGLRIVTGLARPS
jgi:hypothetical protein